MQYMLKNFKDNIIYLQKIKYDINKFIIENITNDEDG